MSSKKLYTVIAGFSILTLGACKNSGSEEEINNELAGKAVEESSLTSKVWAI